MSRQVTSDKNYMKRHPASVTTSMLGPNTSRFFGSYYTRDLVIPHNIGEVPMFRVFYEPYRDGRILEAFHDPQYYFADPINDFVGVEVAPTILSFSDETNITLRMFFINSNLAALSFPIYVIIYWDYGATA